MNIDFGKRKLFSKYFRASFKSHPIVLETLKPSSLVLNSIFLQHSVSKKLNLFCEFSFVWEEEADIFFDWCEVDVWFFLRQSFYPDFFLQSLRLNWVVTRRRGGWSLGKVKLLTWAFHHSLNGLAWHFLHDIYSCRFRMTGLMSCKSLGAWKMSLKILSIA